MRQAANRRWFTADCLGAGRLLLARCLLRPRCLFLAGCVLLARCLFLARCHFIARFRVGLNSLAARSICSGMAIRIAVGILAGEAGCVTLADRRLCHQFLRRRNRNRGVADRHRVAEAFLARRTIAALTTTVTTTTRAAAARFFAIGRCTLGVAVGMRFEHRIGGSGLLAADFGEVADRARGAGEGLRFHHRFSLAVGTGAAVGARTAIAAFAPAFAAALTAFTPAVATLAARTAVRPLCLFAFGRCVGGRAGNADLSRFHRRTVFLVATRAAAFATFTTRLARFPAFARFPGLARLTRFAVLAGKSVV